MGGEQTNQQQNLLSKYSNLIRWSGTPGAFQLQTLHSLSLFRSTKYICLYWSPLGVSGYDHRPPRHPVRGRILQVSPLLPHRIPAQTACVKVSYRVQWSAGKLTNHQKYRLQSTDVLLIDIFRFLTDIYHPNIEKDGKVCISILHEPGDDR